MSSHAWLDSLSEDWPSEPGSPQDSKPPTRIPTTPSSVKSSGTKIPRPHNSQGAQRKLVTTPGKNSSAVLNERSPSDINIPNPSLNHNPFKLSYQGAKESWRSHRSSKSFNADSPAGSIIHNTINRRSTSSSPGKSKGNTPEWKRRLIYGDLAYGEQRDLFTSAATGLEGMFKPPVPSRSSLAQSGAGDDDQPPQHETTFPSSPPGYAQEYSNYETYGDGSSDELPQQPPESRPKPQGVQYKLNDEDAYMSEDSDMSVRRQPMRAATVDSLPSSPSPKAMRAGRDRMRMFSNQSAAQHEDFSPILIGKHNDEDGRIDFAPMNLSPGDLHERLEKVQRFQAQKSPDMSEDESSPDPSRTSNMQTTDELKPLGSFVNVQRGGGSIDDSFRHLRVASGVGNTSEMLSEGSLQASTPKRFPSVRIHGPDGQLSPPTTPSVPAAPYPSPDKKEIRAAGGGPSPLKLFGAYDTFTNEFLLKRIRDANNPSPPIPASEQPQESTQQVEGEVESASPVPSSSKKMTSQAPGSRQQTTRSVSQFGAGELDGYVFNEAFSWISNELGDGSVVHQSPPLAQKASSSPDGAESIVIKKRHQKANSTSSAQFSTHSPRSLSREMAAHAISLIATPTQQELMEYKRPRTSPSKDPTPKRRRTLHESDVAFGAEDDEFLDLLHASLQQMQLPNGIKRKNARISNQRQAANTESLASRHFLRPQTPTPKQKLSPRSETGSRMNQNAFEDEFTRSTQKILKQAHKLNLAAAGERKPSIKTEDFLNEAHRIMAAIRGRSGVGSGLTSVEESDEEHVKIKQAGDTNVGDAEESTREPFSRPPSREGKPVPRTAKRQEDPKLVNHLKKYEEHSDLGDIHIIASSLKSLGISNEDIRAVQALEQNSHSSVSENSENGKLHESEIVSDPPNIRIFENPNRYQYSTAAEEVQHFRSRFVSNGSGSESGYSTGHSVRTGSSRNSDIRKTIAPESVSHLIPDQIGSMVFDRQKKAWVKTNMPQTTRAKRSNTLLSENSEDDPFADIPDLTVDVSKELQNLRNKMAQQGLAGMQSQHPGRFDKAHTQSGEGGMLKSILVKDFADRGKNGTMRSPSKLMRQFVEDDDEDVENEISIQEDRLDDSSPRRKGTVVFSSPISTVIQDMAAAASSEEQGSSPIEQSFVGALPLSAQRNQRNVSINATSVQSIPRSRKSSIASTRRKPSKGKIFVPRAVSVIEEQDEESSGGKADITKELSIFGEQTIAEKVTPKPKRRQTSLNIVVSTPARGTSQPQADNAETLGHYVGNMSLSPISDFTAHPEHSYAFEVSYVLGDQHLATGDGSQKRMSHTVRQLVDKIAEVEEFEPFWEDMKEIKLQDKRLSSLHMLDRFCASLVKVDVSQNSLRALDGIPATVRELTISSNLLSDLTAWDRLANLHFVDVSNNQIKGLSSFRSLLHLRELVADNTGLTSLNGIKYHESLISLRAKGNAITELDFEGACLHKLQTLDLENNKIRGIQNLDELQSLTHLNLKGNQMAGFSPTGPVPLKQLMISDNKLRVLDLAMLSRLHLVYADRNKLTTVLGLDRVPHLDTLSLREQGGSKPFDMTTLKSAYEVRKLFLSGNRLGVFNPPRSFLNLQLLDLANCALQRLPDSLGELMPNLRVLNLNFNGLSDISSLHNVSRLKRLHLVGNRFTDFKPLVNIFAGLPWLTELDLRDNIVTQGFYAPMHLVAQKKDSNGAAEDPFRLPKADPLHDAKFCRLLDIDTRIERRVYERKVVRACKQLQKLDGLPVNKKVRHIKDIVWKTMVERGLLLRPDGSPFDLSNIEIEDEGLSSFVTEENGAAVNESRWGAEDSFA